LALADDAKPRILVVDDEEDIRRLLTTFFQKDGRYRVDTACDGEEGLKAIRGDSYSLVITDLRMPNLPGLSFIRKLLALWPNLPFVVFTGYGEIDDAIEALRLGAFNFLRKPWDLDQVIPAVEKALAVVERTRKKQQVYTFIDSLRMEVSLPPRLEEKDPVIEHLIDPLVPMGLASESDLRNVFLALDETLNNSIVYGALGLDAAMRDEESGHGRFQEMLQERESDPSYQNRVVKIHADYRREEARFRIRDPGEGFDYKNLPDPTDPANLMKEHGRGLLLVQCFMDGVAFNEKGNEVTLIKKQPSVREESPEAENAG